MYSAEKTNCRTNPFAITRRQESCLLSVPRWEPRICQNVSMGALYRIHLMRPKTDLSNVSASRYAIRTSQATSAKSARKRTQLRKLLQEKTRCTTSMAVNSKLDCHA